MTQRTAYQECEIPKPNVPWQSISTLEGQAKADYEAFLKTLLEKVEFLVGPARPNKGI